MSRKSQKYGRINDGCNRHHRRPRSKNGGNGTNIIRVPKSKHDSYHHLFGNMLPQEVCAELNAFWIDPEWMLIAVRR